MELGLRRKNDGVRENKSKMFEEIKGEAAFYGPKLDFEVQATDGKNITIATIQLDFVLPQKFGLNYRDEEQKLQSPVIIHHSPLGSYQRFISLLLEQTQGKLPFWLAPCQVAILPLNEKEETKNYCKKIEQKLTDIGIRAKILTKKTLNYRIRQVYQKKIPYYLAIGEREIKEQKLKLVYAYSAEQIVELSMDELSEKLKAEKKL